MKKKINGLEIIGNNFRLGQCKDKKMLESQSNENNRHCIM